MASINLWKEFDLCGGQDDNYHIIFTYTPDYYVDRPRRLDFYGGDISFLDFEEVAIGSRGYKKIMKFLCKYYGYPPYDYDEVAKSIEVNNHIDF